MKEVAAKHDPSPVFQNLCHGGWKISAFNDVVLRTAHFDGCNNVVTQGLTKVPDTLGEFVGKTFTRDVLATYVLSREIMRNHSNCTFLI